MRFLRIAALGMALSGAAYPQDTAPDTPAAQAQEESEHLNQKLAGAGSTPQDFARALEEHLRAYPDSHRKAEIHRAILKASMEANDRERIIRYGELVLSEDPEDIQALERVTLALLATKEPALARRALELARRLQSVAVGLGEEPQETPRQQAQLREQTDRAVGRALAFQSRAMGNLGKTEEAGALARKAYETFPTAEAARETGNWLHQVGDHEGALLYYAEAFTIEDARNQAEDRAKDRAKLGAIYRAQHGSEAGLGDRILDAYDRTTQVLAQRQARLRELDPNAGLTEPLQYTLTGLNGSLAMESLRGKVVVMDFWATWCGPCRAQHPLYEEVKARFRDRPDVVFLSVNTDRERSAVEPFLKQHGWKVNVYFDDGLAGLLRVSSIPTTIVLGQDGSVAARFNGFNPETFTDQLTEAVERTLAD